MRADNNMLGSLPKAYYYILAFNHDRVFLYAGNIFEWRRNVPDTHLVQLSFDIFSPFCVRPAFDAKNRSE
jgi:hypothetical protein